MRIAVTAALLLLGCGPGQLVLHVDTDAPVPPAPGAPFDPTRPPPLFDRLRIEVLKDGQPMGGADGTRDFAVDAQQFTDGRVSVGIAPPLGDGSFAARVQLFRGDRLSGGVPPALSTLRTTVRLPAVAAGDHLDLFVVLRADDVGQALGEPDPLDADRGPRTPSQVGSWPGATVVPCAAAAPAGQACVSGGAFWFGDPAMRLGPTGFVDSTDERLVVVAPFFVDVKEVTVGAFRVAWPNLGGMFEPNQHDPTLNPANATTWCLWSRTPGAFEAQPINCIAHDTAERYCQAGGGQLPSEAQLEFVSSGRGREWGYPWGNDEPSCDDAVWGRGRGGGASSAVSRADDSCRPTSDLGGDLPAGAGRLDRVTLADPVSGASVEVVDLAGNLAEWARDRWNRLSEPFWNGPGVLADPLVTRASAADPDLFFVKRGGNWTNIPYQLRAAFREGTPEAVSFGVGFRCVHPAR